MAHLFSPRLDILPAAQRRLWPELAGTPSHFTLHGGPAIALRLAHRQSVDFDFFSTASFEPQALLRTLPYLKDATVTQSAANTLTAIVDRGDPVQLSFFGGIDFGQVAAAGWRRKLDFRSPARRSGRHEGCLVTQRAEVRDYLDIHALLTKAKISLPTMLSAGAIIYGSQFNPLLSLKAISYHDDLALAALAPDIRRDLIQAVRTTDLAKLPALNATRRHGRTS